MGCDSFAGVVVTDAIGADGSGVVVWTAGVVVAVVLMAAETEAAAGDEETTALAARVKVAGIDAFGDTEGEGCPDGVGDGATRVEVRTARGVVGVGVGGRLALPFAPGQASSWTDDMLSNRAVWFRTDAAQPVASRAPTSASTALRPTHSATSVP